MQRRSALIVAGLGAALVLLPLGLGLPGFPMHLRADETSHYLLARSLAADGDSLVDARDLDRLFREMPYAGSAPWVVGSDDGWQTARWAVSPLYPLVVAPAAALARTNGVFAFNAICFVLTLWLLGSRLAALRREDDRSLGWVLAGGALFLSASFVYVWWVHPASLRLLLVAAAMCLGWRRRAGRDILSAAAAGACLGLCVAEVPWLLALLPALLARRRGSLRQAVALAGGVGAGVAVALFAGWLAIGHWTADGFAERATFRVDTPDVAPWSVAGAGGAEEPVGLRAVAGPATHARRLALSLVDRRRGLLVLFPFALLFAALALRRPNAGRDDHDRDDEDEDALSRALLAAGLLAVVVSRPFASPEAVDLARYGEPLLAAVWPAFFFLPAARRGVWPGALPILATCAVSALLVLPAVFTPFLPPVAHGDAHHAERSAPSSWLPTGLEEVSEAAGYEVHEVGDAAGEIWRLWLPSYATQRVESSFAFLGGERAEVWLESEEPRADLYLNLQSFAPDNRVVVESPAGGERFTFPGTEPPETTRARIPLDGAWRAVDSARARSSVRVWAAPLVVSTSTGEAPHWRTAIGDLYFTGLRLTVLGSEEHLQRPVWGVRWGACGAPPTAAPGETLRVLARLRNVSDVAWPAEGSVRVRLGTRWRSAADPETSKGDGRADLRSSVAPGEEALVWIETEAPATPGRWRLEIEPVYEYVGWFSDHAEDPSSAVCGAEIEVVTPR